MKYDYSKLFWTLKQKNITQAELANSIGISETTLNKKLKNKVEFKQSEIHSILGVIGISVDHVTDYFFVH